MTDDARANLLSRPAIAAGPADDAARVMPDLDTAVRWHAGWAIALALAAAILLLATPFTGQAGLALAAGAAPALGLLIARNYDGVGLRSGLVVGWALAGALAAILTGGVAGPLSVWCLAPFVAAGLLLQGRRRQVEGASLTLLAVAATALAQAASLVGPAPAGALGFGLGFTGLATMALGIAAGLVLARRTAAPEQTVHRPVVITPPDEMDGEARAILEAQPFLVLVLDPTGQVERAFGRAPAGVAGHAMRGDGLLNLAGEADRGLLVEALEETVKHGGSRFVFRPTGAGPAPSWLALDAARLSEGRIAATLRDVSAERAREARLEAARADAEALAVSKSRFLANMSHELRTPLNAIMGFSDIMRQKIFGPLPGKYVEYADLIHDAGAHLLDLINDVLDMSKIEADKYELNLERLDAREPVSAALRLMRVQADDAGVQLRGVLPGVELEVDADRRAIKQIALNLISNALKFTPRGGLVTVSLHALAGAMELSVADSGIGIAPADLERLGRPYEQAGDSAQQSKGTGLGLSLVRAFAELHGGEMTIESRLGEGTAVSIRLPVLAPAEEPVAPVALSSQPPSSDGPQASSGGGAQVIAFNPQR